MAKRLKNHLSRKLLETLSRHSPNENDVVNLTSKIYLQKHPDANIVALVPVQCVSASCSSKECAHVTNTLASDEFFQSITITEKQKKPHFCFLLNRENFVKQVLESQSSEQYAPPNGKKVLVDFSSPNIAKPMHIGHLRSTIIGNYVSNLHEWFGYDVIRLNYLGDWGTQFGLVKVGMKLLNPTPEELHQAPLMTLYQAYVTANAAAEKNPAILEDAKRVFYNLETGGAEDIADWKLYKELTVTELRKTYARLGVKFDSYSWESDYKASSIGHVLEILNSSGLLATDTDSLKIINIEDRNVPVLKSDGTTLYLTRDIAAAIDRVNTYQCQKMYYVSDTSQHKHFRDLFHILKRLGFSWSENLEHLRFGRVRGMSSRQGTSLFLHDLLDEAKDLMIKQQMASPTTKIDLNDDHSTADILGVSAIIVADFSHKRMKDYNFEWNSAKSVTGNTGVRLQYTHCRLSSLHERCGLSCPKECNPLSLTEQAAVNLVFEIARFDEALERSFNELEANLLADYLFALCNAINKAIRTLRVSNEGKVGEQRLLLFEKSRAVLQQGMTLMGLVPLTKM